MRTYLAKRLLLIVPTLLGVASLVFVIMRVIPGDVALLILGGDSGQIDRAQLAAMHHRLGLDQPLLVRLPLSLELAILATIVAVVLAIPFGILAAVRQDSWLDYVIRVISIGGL